MSKIKHDSLQSQHNFSILDSDSLTENDWNVLRNDKKRLQKTGHLQKNQQ